MAPYIERRRTCWAYSPGGHLAELERSTRGVEFTDCFHITYDCGRTPPATAPRHYHVRHPRRSIVRTLVSAFQTLLVLLRERPQVVISTGADVAVPALLLGKLLGAEIVFIETGGTLAPSLTGRIVYPFADLFIVQWQQKRAAFPKAVLASGPLL